MYWEHVDHVTIRYASNSIISMMHETYGYAGGAHGMTWYTPINLRLSSSGASGFGLDDVFLKGSGWEKKVSELIIADLKKQKAGWITRGEVTEVGVDLLDRFTVSLPESTFTLARMKWDAMLKEAMFPSCLGQL